jgi:ribulose-phosphate 3-epimerase
MPQVAPSILSADFAQLHRAIELVNDSEADQFHLDVMDGVFVPNISFGLPVIEAVKREAQKPLDVHLMIVEPDKLIGEFARAGADILSVHIEACPNLHRTLSSIRENGMRSGIAVNPHTPVEQLEDILPMADLICMMSVNPGYGGQSFIPATYDKIRRLRSMIERKGCGTLIEVDGGVNTENAGPLVGAGADVLVAGSTVFKAEDPKATVRSLKGEKSEH